MHYCIRYMHIKYPLNQANRFVKTVNTQKKLNCINLQLAIQTSKNRSFQTCITRPPIFHPNLRSLGLLVRVQPNTKVISTKDRQTDGQKDGRTNGQTSPIGSFFEKKITKNQKLVSSINVLIKKFNKLSFILIFYIYVDPYRYKSTHDSF